MNFVFDEDIFLHTEYPIADGSRDHLDPDDSGAVNDFTDGAAFATQLREQFPETQTVIDLGTATGSVPFTMRQAGMLAVGLEGSDAAKRRELGCWSAMPDIVRTCDLGKPFRIVDDMGQPVTFDFVTTWDVLEHIPECDIEQFLDNINALMGPESWFILEFSLAYNPADGYHQLWEEWESKPAEAQAWELREQWLRRLAERRWVIDESPKSLCDWQYCRPTPTERQGNLDNGLDEFPISRPLWWLRRRT